MSGFGNSPAKFFIRFTVSGIEPVIACHLEMLFRDVLDKEGNKVHYRDRFFHIGIIFMLIVMKGHVFTVIGINA